MEALGYEASTPQRSKRMSDSNVIETAFGSNFASERASAANIEAIRQYFNALKDDVGAETTINWVLAGLGASMSGADLKRMPKTAAMLENFAKRLK